MGSYFLDTIRHAARRKIEQWQYRLEDMHIRDRLNDNPVIVFSGGAVSIVLLLMALAWSHQPTTSDPFKASKKGWFYDQNTGQLFKASSKKSGPIKAPSGPLPDGSPAGVKAHVYSYAPEPNESDHFIGFLEKPASDSPVTTSDKTDKETSKPWGQNLWIKRPEDKTWVRPTTAPGKKILSHLSRPNHKGQTPIYQKPK
jgi:hypothetical protein